MLGPGLQLLAWQFGCFGLPLWCEEWGLCLTKSLNSFYKPHFSTLPPVKKNKSYGMTDCCLLQQTISAVWSYLVAFCWRSGAIGASLLSTVSFGSHLKSTWQHWILLPEQAFWASVLPESRQGIKWGPSSLFCSQSTLGRQQWMSQLNSLLWQPSHKSANWKCKGEFHFASFSDSFSQQPDSAVTSGLDFL